MLHIRSHCGKEYGGFSKTKKKKKKGSGYQGGEVGKGPYGGGKCEVQTIGYETEYIVQHQE